MFLFSCDQAALWMVLSIRQFVTHFFYYVPVTVWLCSFHRIIMQFSGVIIIDKSDVHAKSQGQKSKMKVREVKQSFPHLGFYGPKSQFLIHRRLRNFAKSMKWHRRGALFKVIHQISKSHRTKNCQFFPNWAFLEGNSSLNSPMILKLCRMLWVAYMRCPFVCQGHL